jgi:hypothetical protein
VAVAERPGQRGSRCRRVAVQRCDIRLIQAYPVGAEEVLVVAAPAGAQSRTVISRLQVTGFRPPDVSGGDTLSAFSDDA